MGGLEAEEEGGEAALDVELNGRDKDSMLRYPSNGETGADGVGIEFEAALVEMVIRHRNRQSSGEPDGRSLSFRLESARRLGTDLLILSFIARNLKYCSPESTQESCFPG